MGMNSIMNLYDAVKNKTNEISLDKKIMTEARISLDRMVNFK
jgi:quinolinate synthase